MPLNDELFVECKLRKKHSVISLWDETIEMAKKESKTPVIALCESGRPGFWVMVHSDDLEKVSNIIKKKIIIIFLSRNNPLFFSL